jgi:hypothetical protein
VAGTPRQRAGDQDQLLAESLSETSTTALLTRAYRIPFDRIRAEHGCNGARGASRGRPAGGASCMASDRSIRGTNTGRYVTVCHATPRAAPPCWRSCGRRGPAVQNGMGAAATRFALPRETLRSASAALAESRREAMGPHQKKDTSALTLRIRRRMCLRKTCRSAESLVRPPSPSPTCST